MSYGCPQQSQVHPVMQTGFIHQGQAHVDRIRQENEEKRKRDEEEQKKRDEERKKQSGSAY